MDHPYFDGLITGVIIGFIIGGALVFWWAHFDSVGFKKTDEALAALANKAKPK